MSSDTCCPYIAAREKRAAVEPFRLTSFGDWVDDSLAFGRPIRRVWTISGEGRAFPSAAPLFSPGTRRKTAKKRLAVRYLSVEVRMRGMLEG
jgi:hypothetical protein